MYNIQCQLAPTPISYHLCYNRLGPASPFDEVCDTSLGHVAHYIPVYPVPPRRHEFVLVRDAPVLEPHMLPRVDTQHRRQIDASWRKWLLRVTEASMCTDRIRNLHGREPAVLAQRAEGRDGLLAPVMRTGVWRASQVCRQEAELLVIGLDKPDEARSEHGRGSGDHFAAKRLNGGEVLLEHLRERCRHGLWVRRKGLEEEVVVVRHRGVVEQGCFVALAGVLDQEVLHGRRGIGSSWHVLVSVVGYICVGHAIPAVCSTTLSTIACWYSVHAVLKPSADSSSGTPARKSCDNEGTWLCWYLRREKATRGRRGRNIAGDDIAVSGCSQYFELSRSFDSIIVVASGPRLQAQMEEPLCEKHIQPGVQHSIIRALGLKAVSCKVTSPGTPARGVSEMCGGMAHLWAPGSRLIKRRVPLDKDVRKWDRRLGWHW